MTLLLPVRYAHPRYMINHLASAALVTLTEPVLPVEFSAFHSRHACAPAVVHPRRS